ncbi:MAG TPA: tetratricopeptide repeat protein [Stellaceae bacterium]|nr:tetratricopeptide repeat protein [Stellaceae bacterium]
MKNSSGTLRAACAVALIALAGCVTTTAPAQLDPLSMNGRDGGGKPPSYPALMKIGVTARAGGDPATALGVFRRAAELAPPGEPAPYVEIGGTLLDMGKPNEAILAYNSALARNPGDWPAQRGLAIADLHTGRPEFAFVPLAKALVDGPKDPGLYVLLGVANDMAGRHPAAQGWYREGLTLAPNDPALTIDLALSLALSDHLVAAVNVLGPIADAPQASPSERQTLSLLYGLEGDRAAAARLARVDLNEAAVEHNLAYFDSLRAMSPEARGRAILSTGSGGGHPGVL